MIYLIESSRGLVISKEYDEEKEKVVSIIDTKKRKIYTNVQGHWKVIKGEGDFLKLENEKVCLTTEITEFSCN